MSTYGTPYTYSETIGNAAEWHDLPSGERCECVDCSWRGSIHDLNPLKHVFERVQPGDVMPDGECPLCGIAVFGEEDEDDNPTGTAHWTPAMHAQEALTLLLRARHHFKEADAQRTLARVRLAISSAKGALRHAQHKSA
jgi:hypothetical protein